jgi:hypothetical protein
MSICSHSRPPNPSHFPPMIDSKLRTRVIDASRFNGGEQIDETLAQQRFGLDVEDSP